MGELDAGPLGNRLEVLEPALVLAWFRSAHSS
jgi:hypothetical protein